MFAAFSILFEKSPASRPKATAIPPLDAVDLFFAKPIFMPNHMLKPIRTVKKNDEYA